MCIFCEIVKGNISSRKVYEDDLCLAILDLAQAGRGHTLVLPKQHCAGIYDADPETLAHMMKVVQQLAIQITGNLKAAGCNIVVNNGEAAGQAISHLHFHIIPRYPGDDYVMKGTEHDYDQDQILAEILGQK